jgi:DNA-binding CsgD family transcriptional regulator
MASALGERGVEANARSHIGIEQAHLGDERAVRRLYHGLRLASSVDDGFITTVINTNLSNVLVFLGRFGEAVDLHHEGIAVADRHGLRTTSGIIFESNILEALEALGRWDEAEAIVDDIKRRLSPESIHRWASALVGWTQIQIHRGHHAEVAASYRRGFELRETGYYSGDLAQLASGLIELAAAGAVEPIDAAAVEAWLDRLPDHESSAGARIVAMAARHLVPPPAASGHRAMAELTDGWIGRLQRIADEEFISVPPVLDAWLDQARAELAEAGGAPAPDRWERLVTSWDELGCRYFAAVARYRQADALLRAGGGRSAADRAVATGLLADADRTAEELAAGPLRDDIDDLARRARLRIGDGADLPAAERPAAEPAPFGLTGRELEVLRLASEGCSNGEIGAELFISTKTASVHVSNILRKLGVNSRVDAAAVAQRLGIA